MLYYTVNVLWYLYDVTRPRTFPPKSWFGGVIESDEEVLEEVDYESDEVQIIEHCGD